MNKWIQQLTKCNELNQRVVLVTVIETKGSTPREVSARMIVTDVEVLGSIGGGNLEFQCIDLARKRLQTNSELAWTNYEHRFPLGASLAQCCGGLVTVLFEFVKPEANNWAQSLHELVKNNARAILVTPLGKPKHNKLVFSQSKQAQKGLQADDFTDYCRKLAEKKFASNTNNTIERFGWGFDKAPYLIEKIEPNDFTIMLFGAGHVGKEIIESLKNVDVRLIIVDNRKDQMPNLLPDNAEVYLEDDPEDAVDKAPVSTYFLVMTHNHQLDFRICEAILSRRDYSYCGLIGSKSKRLKFEKRLLAKDVTQQRIQTLTCPIGIAGLNSKKPAEIAISVAAELLRLYAQRSATQQSQQSAMINTVNS